MGLALWDVLRGRRVVSRIDRRAPRVPSGTNHRADYEGIKWTATDDFNMSKRKKDALDRVGVAMHRHDVHPCDECRGDILDAISAFDRL